MRYRIISELYRNLLGPKNGPFEIIKNNPVEEYITGILAPAEAEKFRDPDSDAEVPSILPEDEAAPEDDIQDDPLLGHITFLDPTTQPRSMGLSFSVIPEAGRAEIKICVTWARYRKTDGGWKRQPRYHVMDSVPIEAGKPSWRFLYLNGSGQPCRQPGAEVGIYILTSPDTRRKEHINVSVFLVNELRLGNVPAEKRSEQYILQPQIRVKIVRGKLESVGDAGGGTSDEEEEELRFVYRDRKVLARGHMCSAVWRDVDPERPHDHNWGEPPFSWIDGEVVDDRTKKEFTNPDVRTEFIPVYSVEAPSYEWCGETDTEPVLESAKLAELWNPEELERALSPLADGYERWIRNLEEEASSMPPEDRKVAERVIHKCRRALERIREGIRILKEDRVARLAFCFANKVMDLQRTWINRQKGIEEGLRWRPFQLAFILLSLPSIVNGNTQERGVCDVLFVPTGAGKTEAYLCLAAFTLAYRRRRALLAGRPLAGEGVGVIMRYTLRLLTIQQFRRALSMITACEYLRVSGLKEGGPVGWRPKNCDIKDDFIWGASRFSIGLWVGGNVTPNRLGRGRDLNGALDILRGQRGRHAEGEPAQIIRCPVCGAVLSVPDEGALAEGGMALHYLVKLNQGTVRKLEKTFSRWINSVNSELSENSVKLELEKIAEHGKGYATISLKIRSQGRVKPEIVETIWKRIESALKTGGVHIRLQASHPSRPGYFLRYLVRRSGAEVPYDFDIYCPNPECSLNSDVLWCEGHPHPEGGVRGIKINGRTVALPEGVFLRRVPDHVRYDGKGFLSYRIPLPALTVDEQVYTRPPSFLVGTVDKVARIAFEARSGALFGNVDFYHPYLGYYREGLEPPTLSGMKSGIDAVRIEPLDPPDLIIQDELHLIEGPLGSMVGLYEAAVDLLCMKNGIPVKYIASSATIRGANSQVRSVFARDAQIFPPYGLRAHDRFFIRQRVSPHPLDESNPGRAYVGICSPGKGPLTPVRRIWGVLLQTVHDLAQQNPQDADYFWTLVGYFNAIRELAGAVSLYRQDIPEELLRLAGDNARDLPEDNAIELSSRTSSTELPVRLEELERGFTGDVKNPGSVDALFTTSMFGTGVDITRLSLMVVHGQPKTTSQYIQSTGRVGRGRAGLIVTFYRSTRPRDMSHYELFCGYHMNLERFVEPVTAAPFSEGSLDRCCGPVCVGILRNMKDTQTRWHTDDSAFAIIDGIASPEIRRLVDFLFRRAEEQPPSRRPNSGEFRWFVRGLLERWMVRAREIAREGGVLKYAEYGGVHNHVVLGDPPHQYRDDIIVVFENAPQSLRDIEETTSFET